MTVARLWHLLSEPQLEAKRVHARTRRCALLMTLPNPETDLSKGKAGAYLSCLKTPVSGFDFTGGQTPRLLYIDLDESAEGYHHRGDPDQIDWLYVARRYDFAEIVVDAQPTWPVRFTELLLFRDKHVRAWGHEIHVVREAFMQAYYRLDTHRLDASDYYLNDLLPQEQQVLAGQLGARLGLLSEPQEDAATDLHPAFERIGFAVD